MPTTVPPYEVAETIRHYKSQYARAVDTKQWDLFSSLLHPALTASLHDLDGSLTTTSDGTKCRFSSREEYILFLRTGFANICSVHVVGAGELEMVNDEDDVAAVWAMSYQLGSLDGAAGGGYTEIGGGHYHEVWKKLDGQWVIASLKFVNSFRKVI
ncbi:hypothetical protein BJY01DRAFT_221969 [Aspergillus pseudoustus]|uniref:SnoaL-like domain-containing protein n=1 Tax=Aspergillus pseudoustus TaxID=1810923 RepID=A0ABR4J906_9EURO